MDYSGYSTIYVIVLCCYVVWLWPKNVLYITKGVCCVDWFHLVQEHIKRAAFYSFHHQNRLTHTPHSTIHARINRFLPFIYFFVLKQWASIIVTVTFKILLFKLKTYRREKIPKRSENRFAWDETKIDHCIFLLDVCVIYLVFSSTSERAFYWTRYFSKL